MRILKITAQNFGSYDYIEFTPSDKGLTLISGPTGSGKSTLCDLVPWCLFGQTAKNGSVSEVVKWNATSDTSVAIELVSNDKTYTIKRTRGKQNDLVVDADLRGKDIPDTQRIINQVLNVTPDLYLAGAYFHEFSQTASFFITTAKNRRVICEQIVDLSLNKQLTEKLSNEIKTLDKQIKTNETQVFKAVATSETLTTTIASLKTRVASANQEYQAKLKNFKSTVAKQLKALDGVIKDLMAQMPSEADIASLRADMDATEATSAPCPTCGSTRDNTAYKELEKQYKALEMQAYKISVEIQKNEFEYDRWLKADLPQAPDVNHIQAELDQLQATKITNEDIIKMRTIEITKDKATIADLELLQDVNAAARATMIKSAIQDIQYETNRILNDYYDGEITVQFDVEAADKLDVTISKDGNQCSYTQLSKGQRQMLKLAFGISVMKQVKAYSGVNFQQIYLDEALDGLDENLKIKSYRLLEALSLEYSSVFVVEHSSALKEMFPNRVNVSLTNNQSILHEE